MAGKYGVDLGRVVVGDGPSDGTDVVLDPIFPLRAADRTMAAAMLDVLWAVGSYERLAADWEFEPEQAIRAITWVIGLIDEAIQAGRRPSGRASGG